MGEERLTGARSLSDGETFRLGRLLLLFRVPASRRPDAHGGLSLPPIVPYSARTFQGGSMKTSALAVAGLPLLVALAVAPAARAADPPDRLRNLASDYYRWRSEQFPVASSDQGLHTWDDRLTDYSAAGSARAASTSRRLADRCAP